MDIVVTIPKSTDWEEWLQECKEVENDSRQRLNYYLGSQTPKEVEPGDKCYILHNGEIRGYHEIDNIRNSITGFRCLVTGKYWSPGVYVVRKGQFHEIKPIKHKGFQGFRYRWWGDDIGRDQLLYV